MKKINFCLVGDNGQWTNVITVEPDGRGGLRVTHTDNESDRPSETLRAGTTHRPQGYQIALDINWEEGKGQVLAGFTWGAYRR